MGKTYAFTTLNERVVNDGWLPAVSGEYEENVALGELLI